LTCLCAQLQARRNGEGEDVERRCYKHVSD